MDVGSRLASGDASSVATAVSLLQEAAGACEESDEEDESGRVSSAVRLVAENLAKPNMEITEAVIQLLALFPRAVLPYVADVISSEEVQISMAFAAYRELLAGDRSLLVPIAASLADLPLSPAQQAEFRSTLDFALTAVDEDDLPAVIRAVSRLSSSAYHGWAVTSIRRHTSSISPAIFTLVAEIVRDMARINPAVARAFLKPMTLPSAALTAIDIVMWTTALESYRDGSVSVDSITKSCAIGTLQQDKLVLLLHKFRQALEASTEGLRRMALIVLNAKSTQGHKKLSHCLYRQLLLTYPELRVDLINDLVCSNVTAAFVILRDLALDDETSRVLASAVHLLEDPLHRPQSLDTMRHTLLSSALTAVISHRPDLYNSLFILIRKQLLFGSEIDRKAAVSFAGKFLPKLEHNPEFGELLSLLDTSLPLSLDDSATVEYMALLSRSSLLMSPEVASNLWTTRLSHWIPPGLFIENQNELVVDLGKIPSAVLLKSVWALISASIGVLLRRRSTSVSSSTLSVGLQIPSHAKELCDFSGLTKRLSDRQAEFNTEQALESIPREKRRSTHQQIWIGCSLVAESINVAVELDDNGRQKMDLEMQGLLVAKVLEWSKLYTASNRLAEQLELQDTEAVLHPTPVSVKILLSSLTDGEEATITSERLVLEKALLSILVNEASMNCSGHSTVNPINEQDFVEVLVSRLNVYMNNTRRLRRDQSIANARGDCWESASLELRVETMLSLTVSVLSILQRTETSMTRTALSKALSLRTGDDIAQFCRHLVTEALNPATATMAIEVLTCAIAHCDDCYVPGVTAKLWIHSLSTVYELYDDTTDGIELNWPGYRESSLRMSILSKRRPGFIDRYRLGALLCSLPAEEALIEAAGWTRALDNVLRDRVEGNGDTSGSGPPCFSRGPLELFAEMLLDFAHNSLNLILTSDQSTPGSHLSTAMAGFQVVDGVTSFLNRLAKTKEANLHRCLSLLGRILLLSKRAVRLVVSKSNTPLCSDENTKTGTAAVALACRVARMTATLTDRLKKRPSKTSKNRSLDMKIARSVPRLAYNAEELLSTANIEVERYHVDLGDPPLSCNEDARYVIGCGIRAAEESVTAFEDRETTLGLVSDSKTEPSSREMFK